jgi:hypothetical protein
MHGEHAPRAIPLRAILLLLLLDVGRVMVALEVLF